jgi:ribosomal protein L22
MLLWSTSSPSSELLSKIKWYDGTIKPYYYTPTNTTAAGSVKYHDKEHHLLLQQQQQQTQMQIHQSQKNITKYFGRVIENIAKNANNK